LSGLVINQFGVELKLLHPFNTPHNNNELDYEYVVDLRNALAKAIKEADDCYGGQCPNLDKERALLLKPLDDDL
jgi:hypothetical protein